MPTIYERIKEVSDKRKMSIDYVNDKAGLSNKAIYGWKKSTPKADMNPSSATQTEFDLKQAIENDIMLAFDGKPISDKYKRIIIELLSEEDD